MKIKSEKDFWSGIMFIVVGVAFAIGAMNYSMGPNCPAGAPCATSLYARFTQLSAHPGAGYFPLGLSVIMTFIGAVILFESLLIETEDGERVGSIAWRPLLVIVAAIAVFGALLEPLGLFLSIPVLIVMTSFAGDEFHWPGVLISAATLTAFSWAVFIWGLKLTLPILPWFAR